MPLHCADSFPVPTDERIDGLVGLVLFIGSGSPHIGHRIPVHGLVYLRFVL